MLLVVDTAFGLTVPNYPPLPYAFVVCVEITLCLRLFCPYSCRNSYCNSFPDENKNGEKLFPELTNRSPSSRRRPLLPIQCTTPKQDSYFLSSAEYTSTPCMAKPKPKQMSYADVLKPSSKRTVNERYCLSPVEGPAKKHQICDTPQSADIEFLPKEQTPGHLERFAELSCIKIVLCCMNAFIKDVAFNPRCSNTLLRSME